MEKQTDNGVFSARLEALISAALQDGVLTEKEKTILKKRAEAEGEDWDEVEMIINARLAERQPTPQVENGIGKNIAAENGLVEKPQTQKVVKEAVPPQEEKSSDIQTIGNNALGIVNNDEKILIIPEWITKIKKSQYNVSQIESVVFPTTLKAIGSKVFEDCENLEVLEFCQCSQLEIISDDAFKGCKKIKSVIFPSSLKTLGESAFSDCINLEVADFSKCVQLTEINKCAFANCQNIKSVIFPSSLKTLGESAFSDCINLEVVDFSKCVQLTEIDKYAFANCKKLTTLDLSHCSSLFKFHRKVLQGCDNIRLIDFSGCKKLNLNYDQGASLRVPTDNLEKIILPSGQKGLKEYYNWDNYGFNVNVVDISHVRIKHIYGRAFQGMKMKEIAIPDTVEIIDKDNEGWGAFYGCKNIVTIVMPAGLKEIKGSLGGGMEQLKSIDFSKVRNLKIIPKHLVGYGCNKLTELIIPLGVTEIEDDAFAKVGKLKRLFLPPTLESIGDLGLTNISIYCFSPLLEELEPLVYGWEDKNIKIDLFVLPQYFDKYIAQREAERIPDDVLVIEEIPDEYRYCYDY